MDSMNIYTIFPQLYQKFKRVVNSRSVGRYFFVMLFVKYISDCWKDAYERYSQQYGYDQELIQRKMSRERFVLSENASFEHIVAQINNSSLGDIINKALNIIEEDNKDKLDGVFGLVDFNSEYDLGETRERNHFLKELIYCFERINLRPSNAEQLELIDACMFTIAGFTEIASPKGGEFFTPADLSRLMARLMEPKAGDRIYDPLCGSGSLLAAAASEVKNANGHPSDDYALYGQEINKEIRAWATLNMYLYGLDHVQVAPGDIITDPAWKEEDLLMKFDVVVSNLPFSSDNWGAENAEWDKYGRFKWGIPPRKRGDYAFIQHIIASAEKDNGRMGIVVPQSALFREGKELPIRKGIIEDNLVEAIIALPSNLFAYTAAPCAIMILNKAKGKNKNVLFINATKDFEPGKHRNKLQEEHIRKIITTYQQFKKDPAAGRTAVHEKYSRVVTSAEIAALDHNLHVPKYVNVDEEWADEQLNVLALQQEIALLEKELIQIRSAIQKESKDLGLGNLSS